MSKPRPVSFVITVETTFDDGTKKELRYDVEHCEVIQEFGFDFGQPSSLQLVEKKPNGQVRTVVRGWTGMTQWSDLWQGGERVAHDNGLE